MAAVDQVTGDLAKASINDKNAGQSDAVLAIVAEGRRLYIGNLAYATTEGDLKEFFKDFKVESVSIPTNPRTSRPVGYAFVDLVSASEAEKAIADLSGKEVKERKVSVQLARKPETPAEKAEAAAANAGEGASGGETRRRASGRGRGRGRGGRGGRTGRGGRAADSTGNEVLPLTDTTAQANNAQKSTDATEEGKDGKTRAPRQPRQRGPPEDGIPSKNKVMVANLPYDLSEEKLKEIFAAYNPTAAKIALRPIPRFMVKKLQARNEPRKGRGFGFVSLESEEMQQKAVAEMNDKDIEGRVIVVKVAIDSPGKEDDIAATAALAENGAAEAPAATA